MSSPLDGRIRAIAREEVSALLGDGAPHTLAVAADAGQEQGATIAELQAQVKHLSNRLDEVERMNADEQRPAARRTRKTAE
jgi:hypothetical protein